IKYIAYTIFAISLINIFYYLFLKYIWIKKIIIPDINMDIAINWESLELLFWGVIILVIAEVYRLGTEIKKEQELTI
ncbi:MAG: DUF2975 domain-containing protein, partial [Bacteroidota bacterium]|nr:DUF2975 domain-containing protein [Bacteroidota bacterium]